MNSKEQERFVIMISDIDQDFVKGFCGTLDGAHDEASRVIGERWKSPVGDTPITIDYTVTRHDMDLGEGMIAFDDLTLKQKCALHQTDYTDCRTVFAPTPEPKCSVGKPHDYQMVVSQSSIEGLIDVQVCKACGLIRFVDTYNNKRDFGEVDGFCTEYNVAAYRP